MNKLLKTEAMKRLTKRVKSKRGTTLIELIATVAILSIIASLSFEAMFMAAEEFRRVRAISESERSISLFQDNLNLYAKNAIDIEFVDNSADDTFLSSDTVYTALRKYIDLRSYTEPLQDAERRTSHKYIDIFIYRSDDFKYTIGKYKLGSNLPETILEVDNIKEVNFALKQLTSSFSNPTKSNYLLDYAVVSPTNFEMTAADKTAVASGDVIDEDNYSNKSGSYSVMTGTVLNNITDPSVATSNHYLRICENLDGVDSESDYKGDFNFVVIRTVKREAK